MQDSNRLYKWGLVLLTVGLGFYFIWPPQDRLKPGIDLAGGTRLVYEIDTTGLQDYDIRRDGGIATRTMSVLKPRVDPNSAIGLVWRPIGNTRLEIQMPEPPQTVKEKRRAKDQAMAAIDEKNVARGEIEQLLSTSTPENAEAALKTLVKGVKEREAPFSMLAKSYVQMAAQQNDMELSEAFEDAMERVLATNLRLDRFNDILSLGEKNPARKTELDRLRQSHPSYVLLMDAAIEKYDAWVVNKSELEDPSDLKRRLKGAGVLEFRILAERDSGNPGFIRSEDPSLAEDIGHYVESLQRRGPRLGPGDRYQWFPIQDVADFLNLDDRKMTVEDLNDPVRRQNAFSLIVERYTGRWYVLAHSDPDFGLTQRSAQRWKLTGAFPDRDPATGRLVVIFRLDPVGGDLFGRLTEANVNRQLCIFLDGEAMSTANIEERIGESGRIMGNFTQDEVGNLVRILEAGALPGRLKETPISEETVGPSIGAANLGQGFKAAVWALIMVVVFMIFYYGFIAGGIANIALLLNLLFTLAAMAMLEATFTLAGIAGVILSIGMAVDGNVLIYERVREETERGAPLRKAINAGYERAFTTIVDSNLTTLITCIILGYAGSEEVKGFAITLGIGIATSMYTAQFVTRMIFNEMLNLGWIKSLSMRRIIRTANIDWMGNRWRFFAASLIIVTGSLALFFGVAAADPASTFDIEFMGGTSVQLDFLPNQKVDERIVGEWVSGDDAKTPSSAQWLVRAADALGQAQITAGAAAGEYQLRAAGLSGEQIRLLIRGHFETAADSLESRVDVAVIHARVEQIKSVEDIKNRLAAVVDYIRAKGVTNMRTARVTTVGELGAVQTEGGVKSFEVVTVESNRGIVEAALMAVMRDKLLIEPSISFSFAQDESGREDYFVVHEEDRYLRDVIGGPYPNDIRRFKGGAVFVIENMDYPLTRDELVKRLSLMRSQPEFEDCLGREVEVFEIGDKAQRADGTEAYKRFAIAVVDDNLLYGDLLVDQWTDVVATRERALVQAALTSSESLRKIVQFAPQVAEKATQDALIAMVLSFIAIVIYVWARFGTMQYGLAGIIALFHDVAVALGVIAASHFIAGTFIGDLLLVRHIKIDLAMVAALLTIIGYSINDTIVIFDRIRENRGKSARLTETLINKSINETLSRTLLTAFTTFLVVLVFYVVGGDGTRGFSLCFLVGVFVGSYSSIGVASALVYEQPVMAVVMKVLYALTAMGLAVVFISSGIVLYVILGLIVAALIYFLRQGEPIRMPERAASAT